MPHKKKIYSILIGAGMAYQYIWILIAPVTLYVWHHPYNILYALVVGGLQGLGVAIGADICFNFNKQGRWPDWVPEWAPNVTPFLCGGLGSLAGKFVGVKLGVFKLCVNLWEKAWSILGPSFGGKK